MLEQLDFYGMWQGGKQNTIYRNVYR